MAHNFQLADIDDHFDARERQWIRAQGRVPQAWLRAYLKPIRVALADFSAFTAKPLLDAWGVHAAEELRIEMLQRFGVDAPTLPWVRFTLVNGGVEKLRACRADLLLVRCNGCAHLHPSHWIETIEDEDRARRLEKRHPAVCAFPRGVAVTNFSTYEGCYCETEFGGLSEAFILDREDYYDERLRLGELAMNELIGMDELELAREIAKRALAIPERCAATPVAAKEGRHGRRHSA
jgi:hypothetical protein